MIDEIRSDAKQGMEKSLEALRHELASIRTGRATTSLLDGIRVNYYGSMVPIKQVANIGVPEPRLVAIQPWEPKMVPVIEKAVLSSGLGLTPISDGTIIRLPIPQLTEERRHDLARMVRKLAEEGRISIRNVRRDANELLKEATKEGEVSEDDSHRGQREIQDLTDEYIHKVDQMLEMKEQEIMEV